MIRELGLERRETVRSLSTEIFLIFFNDRLVREDRFLHVSFCLTLLKDRSYTSDEIVVFFKAWQCS
jgi:hypothetical protein